MQRQLPTKWARLLSSVWLILVAGGGLALRKKDDLRKAEEI